MVRHLNGLFTPEALRRAGLMLMCDETGGIKAEKEFPGGRVRAPGAPYGMSTLLEPNRPTRLVDNHLDRVFGHGGHHERGCPAVAGIPRLVDLQQQPEAHRDGLLRCRRSYTPAELDYRGGSVVEGLVSDLCPSLRGRIVQGAEPATRSG